MFELARTVLTKYQKNVGWCLIYSFFSSNKVGEEGVGEGKLSFTALNRYESPETIYTH